MSSSGRSSTTAAVSASKRVPRTRQQSVDARRHQGLEPGGQAVLVVRVERHHELFEEQRVARGALHDALDVLGQHRRRRTRGHQRLGVLARQRLQLHDLADAPAREPRPLVAPANGQHGPRPRLRLPSEVAHQRSRRVVQPLGLVDHHE
jgi:hypothetical protein